MNEVGRIKLGPWRRTFQSPEVGVMTEMRWLETPEPELEAEKILDIRAKTRVLQYRTRAYDEVEWGEWKDVPIVRAE